MGEKECKHCNNESEHQHNKNHEHEHTHGHSHDHGHNHEHEELSKLDIAFYIVSIILFAISFIPSLESFKMIITLIAILLSGYKLLIEGIVNIFKLNFKEDTLMVIAVIAAFALGDYPESLMVILLFRLGEFLEEKAVEKSNENIKSIVEIKSKTANRINENGKTEKVDVEEINVGDKILIKPGEMVPLDCIIDNGNSNLDMSSLTGESIPVHVEEGKEILSGSMNLTGSLTCSVKRDYKNSTASKIVDLVEEATNNKGKTEEFITKFSKVYTPIVIILAIIVAIIVPLLLKQDFKTWIMRSLVFLVASCPCSIVISVPLAFFSCIGKISKKGMIVKGTKHIENLSKAKYVAFDKTGTITTGKMKIEKLISNGNYSEEELLKYIHALEENSNHPISTAIKQEVENKSINADFKANNYEEIAGCGLKGIINDKEVLFGNKKLLEVKNIKDLSKENTNYIVIDNNVEGYITFTEEIRKEIEDLTKELSKMNIKKTVMLTGDNKENAEKIANLVGINTVYSSLLPKEKLEKVRFLKEEGKVIYVGDGINDSPVLAESDFGISMGEGSEIASSTADGILISNNIQTLPEIIKIAKKTMRIIKFNIVFSLIIKAIVLTLGVVGIAPIWLAVIADTGVSLITVINSVRILKK